MKAETLFIIFRLLSVAIIYVFLVGSIKKVINGVSERLDGWTQGVHIEMSNIIVEKEKECVPFYPYYGQTVYKKITPNDMGIHATDRRKWFESHGYTIIEMHGSKYASGTVKSFSVDDGCVTHINKKGPHLWVEEIY